MTWFLTNGIEITYDNIGCRISSAMNVMNAMNALLHSEGAIIVAYAGIFFAVDVVFNSYPGK